MDNIDDNKEFYFENKEDGHSKFWAITLVYDEKKHRYTLIRKWGRVGDRGRSMVENYAYNPIAFQKRDKLIQEKIAKGYIAVL